MTDAAYKCNPIRSPSFGPELGPGPTASRKYEKGKTPIPAGGRVDIWIIYV